MLTFALIAAALAQTPQHRLFLQPNLPRVAKTSLADALQPGDLAGAWWAMYGDGTMRSGSAVTLVPTGAPTNTVENGYAVRTYTGVQNDQEPANVAFPASDFSVCKHVRLTISENRQIMAFGTSGASANHSSLPMELQLSGALLGYASDGAADSTVTQGAAITNNVWHLLCYTYRRVGGAADNVATLYMDGIQTGTSSTQRLVQTLSSVWSTNGYAGGVTGTNHATRGAFVTYKLLSADDIARIYASTAG